MSSSLEILVRLLVPIQIVPLEHDTEEGLALIRGTGHEPTKSRYATR